MKKYLLLFLIACNSFSLHSSEALPKDSIGFFENAISPDKKRIRKLNYTMLGAYGISMTWLYSQWYKDYETTSFHFFNDFSEWEQMDKYAHVWDAYNISKPIYKSYRWGGYDEKKAVWSSVAISFLFLTTVEVFDGFSSEWGFSGGDILSNTAGVGLFAAQQLKWNEQRMVLKYSFRQTKYSQYRPQLLGNNLPENILKDYNGLTFWLTINPKSFFKSSKIPAWLSLAVGFGAEGMTGGKNNPIAVEGKPIPYFERYKQYYLAIDIDLARIQTKSKTLSAIFKLINIIHLPAPAIEFSGSRKPRYHGLYF
jgi:hypothetical protein